MAAGYTDHFREVVRGGRGSSRSRTTKVATDRGTRWGRRRGERDRLAHHRRGHGRGHGRRVGSRNGCPPRGCGHHNLDTRVSRIVYTSVNTTQPPVRSDIALNTTANPGGHILQLAILTQVRRIKRACKSHTENLLPAASARDVVLEAGSRHERGASIGFGSKPHKRVRRIVDVKVAGATSACQCTSACAFAARAHNRAYLHAWHKS